MHNHIFYTFLQVKTQIGFEVVFFTFQCCFRICLRLLDAKGFSSAFAAGLLALVCVCSITAEVGAVAVQVVAGVRGCWGGSWAKSAALGAVGGDVRLVARGLGQSCAVAVDVVAGSLSGDGGIGGSGHSLTLGHCHRLANTTHTNSTLEPDEAVLSPSLAPGVLHLPIVHPCCRVSAVPNDSHRVVGLVAGAAGEDPSLVILERSRGTDTGHDGSVLCNEALQGLLIPAVCVVDSRYLGSLVVVVQSWAGEGWVGVLVRVGCLGGEIQSAVSKGLDVGVRVGAVAPVRPVLLVPAVNQLLLRVVTEDSSGLLEAGLDGRHVGEGHTRSALLPVLHLADQTQGVGVVAGRGGGSVRLH